MLGVSQSSFEKADQPTSVMPATFTSKCSCFRDLFPTNPSAKAAAPSSPIFIPLSLSSFKAQLSDWKKVDSELKPAAVIDRLPESHNSDRLLQFVIPATKACSPLSSIELPSRSSHCKFGACQLLSMSPSAIQPSLPMLFPFKYN